MIVAPSENSNIECTIELRGVLPRRIFPVQAAKPKQQVGASINSRPLFTSCGREVIVTQRAMFKVGWARGLPQPCVT